MTTPQQPPAVADADTFTVTRTVHVAAPVERVWRALTHEEHMTRWFGARASLPEVRVGAEGYIGFEGYGDFVVRVEEVDEHRVFAYTWGAHPGDPEPLADGTSTLVRFTLAPDHDGTRLTVTETGFGTLTTRDPRQALEDNRQGWTSELDELVAYLERDVEPDVEPDPVRSA
ncbi:SRPBCC family protein [Cellulomonas sp.]|uniref:SRPBCC family protein n=1 Tax=Cellulomonas sp. TaxID=40001 RepID=UPI001B27CB89|nr:SRPBCC family protein [Cellulomonas sp.]MBO9554715.1 SRPBCC family protein [Cellulomonas sp.]